MSKAVVRFLHEKEGTEMVEWGVIAGMVVVLTAGLFLAIGTDLNNIFGDLQTQTCKAADQSKSKKKCK